MNYLFICGSVEPTYCGIGKYTGKVARMLQHNNFEVQYLTDYVQNDINNNINKNSDSFSGRIHYFNSKKAGLVSIYKLVKSTNPDVVNIEHQTFGKNFSDCLFGLTCKLAYSKVKVINTIHEFNHFSTLGKIRLSVNGLFADRLVFSDTNQLKKFKAFTRNIFANKSISTIVGSGVDMCLTNFDTPEFSDKTLNIVFHGFIQEAKGLHFILEALAQFTKPFTLTIIGEFKVLLQSNTQDDVLMYQKKCLDIIERNPVLQSSVLVTGDVDPTSKAFQDFLLNKELAIFPFLDSVTLRRTSFVNTLINSKCNFVSTFDADVSEPVLESVKGIEASADSILHFLNTYSNLTPPQKQELNIKQLALRNYLLPKNTKEQIVQDMSKFAR